MKLKTLKDLVKETMKEAGIQREEDCLIDWEELKAEAVKWVKDCSGSVKWENNEERCSGCRWFIKFFNLTAEDLK